MICRGERGDVRACDRRDEGGRTWRWWALPVLFALLVFPIRASSAEAPGPARPPEPVETLVVTGTPSKAPLARIPAAVSVVTAGDGRRTRPTVGLDEPLRRVPGVFVQNSGNYAQDFRVQVRGFGTRAAFGLREITVLVDGLPETLPDGQSQIDTIELGAVERIEVLRGPGAALYGNAAGGVLHLRTDPPPDRPGATLRITGGSFGLAKLLAQVGGRHGNLGAIATGSTFRTDGYREHSSARASTFLGRLHWDADEDTRFSLLADGVYAPRADDPGGLTEEEARADPQQARERNVRLDAGEAVDQVRLAAMLDRQFDTGHLAAYAYALYRDFEAKLPILPSAGDGIVQFDRVSPGAGLRYTHEETLFGFAQRLTVGVEAQHQHDDRQRFANEEGQKGAQGLDQIERVTGIGVFLHETLSLTKAIEVSAGVRWNGVRYAVDVRTPPDSDASGTRTLDQWSPGGGVLWAPTAHLQWFANVATAFQAPTTTELVNPDGPGFNPDIEPQTARSYELGLRFTPAGLEVGASLYRIDIDDELIPYETPAGRVAFRNAGRSRRLGFEVDWRSEPLPGVVWSGAATALHGQYLSYRTDDGDFSGNREPGIPPWFVFQEVAYTHDSGLIAAIEGYLVGSYFVDDANTARAAGYGLINLRLAWSGMVGGWALEPFVGLQNLTNARYDGTVRLNAFGGRYYEPAPGFNVYGGLRLESPSG